MAARISPAFPVRLLIWTAIAVTISISSADPDLWGHVLFGRQIIESRSLPRVDPYSFTSDRPWVNHEWLTEITLYGAYAVAGPYGLIALRIAIVASIVLMSRRWLRGRGTPPVLTDVLLLLAVLGIAPRTTTIRPQLFSLLLFTILLGLVSEATLRRRYLRIWTVPLLFVPWVNLHGGWLVGLGVFSVWCATVLLSRRQELRRSEVVLLIAAPVLALCLTLVNPYGFEMLDLLASTVRPSRPDITEWQPLTQHPLLVLPWLALVAVAVWPFFRHRRVAVEAFAILGTLAVGAFKVNRLDAFFVLAVVVFAGPEYSESWRAWRVRSRPFRREGIALLSAALVPPVLIAATVMVRNLRCVSMEHAWWAPEPQAITFLESSGLGGRLVLPFNWGELAIWHLYPRFRVAIDGRRETVYSDEYMARYRPIAESRAEGRSVIESLKPSVVWLARDTPLAHALEESGWHRSFEGPRSVVLTKSPVPPGPKADRIVTPRCFPGP